MKIEKLRNCKNLTHENIKSFEDYIGASLPGDYKDFLSEYNGGIPEVKCFSIGKNDESLIQEFLGVNCTPDYNDIKETIKMYDDRIPKTFLPIADDPFGNTICLGIGNNNFNKIFFLDHERENCSDYITEIANSFNEFIHNLYECEDEDNKDEIRTLIKENNVEAIKNILDNGYPIEQPNEYNRTILEEAAISAKDDIIKLLHEKGALVRNSISLAEQNAEFFPQHKITLALLQNLYA